MLLLALACTSETGITEGEPRLELEVEALDFDEVVVGSQVTLSFELENSGIAALEVSGGLEGHEGYALVELPSVVAPRSSDSVSVRLAPEQVGEALGALVLHTNDPDAETVTLELTGEGVEPRIDVDPESLWFGDIPAGGSSTLPVDIVARGQGRLRLDTLQFADDEGQAFSFELPEGVELPHKLDSGTGIELLVTFAPEDEAPWDGSLLIGSNDPEDPVVAVRLLGNAEEQGQPPEVEITSPDWGNYFLTTDVVDLEGVVVDDGGLNNLLVAWYADGALLDTVSPESDGRVSLQTSLSAGEQTLTLRATDGTGQQDSDEVTVTVWAPDEPAEYVLSGGSSIFDHWSVDDDVAVYLDGASIFEDDDGGRSTHAPLSFEAEPGQTLRVVATDLNFCEKQLDALVLHWGTEASQDLNDSVCVSSCPEDACYDASYGGPWPNDFVDESWVISIP
jgi:hypothetical protein